MFAHDLLDNKIVTVQLHTVPKLSNDSCQGMDRASVTVPEFTMDRAKEDVVQVEVVLLRAACEGRPLHEGA